MVEKEVFCQKQPKFGHFGQYIGKCRKWPAFAIKLHFLPYKPKVFIKQHIIFYHFYHFCQHSAIANGSHKSFTFLLHGMR